MSKNRQNVDSQIQNYLFNEAIKVNVPADIIKEYLLSSSKYIHWDPFMDLSSHKEQCNATSNSTMTIFSLEDIKKMKTLFFGNEVLMEKVVEFLLPLIAGGPNKRFLSEKDFCLFLQKAFLNINIEPLTASNLSAKKGRFVNIFYQLYLKKEYFDCNHKHERFVALISDNFKGFPFDKVKNNFRSS